MQESGAVAAMSAAPAPFELLHEALCIKAIGSSTDHYRRILRIPAGGISKPPAPAVLMPAAFCAVGPYTA